MSDSRPSLWAKFWALADLASPAAPPVAVKPPEHAPILIHCKLCGGAIVIGSVAERQHILCGRCGAQSKLEPQDDGTAIITALCGPHPPLPPR